MKHAQTTEDLIASLAAGIPRVSPGASARRLGLGLGLGAAAAFAGTVLVLGPRPDLTEALAGAHFWMKGAYTAALAALGVAWVGRIGRPAAALPDWRWLLLPVALLALVAGAEWAGATNSEQRRVLLLGASWRVCSCSILLLAVPLYIGLLWVFRRMAPTRLRVAGALAGLASGASAATIYGLHCPESSMVFVLIWYSLGIVLAAALGALAGPRLLRW